MNYSPRTRLILSAMFAALICVSTMIVHIPLPVTGGYANLGDGAILTCAFLLNPAWAAAAAGLGSMLADLLAGYATYAPGTLIIKAGVAFIASMLYGRFGRGKAPRASFLSRLTSGVLAETFMVFGYFAYEALALGYGFAAAASVPGNIGQGAVGILTSIVLVSVLSRSREMNGLMEKPR